MSKFVHKNMKYVKPSLFGSERCWNSYPELRCLRSGSPIEPAPLFVTRVSASGVGKSQARKSWVLCQQCTGLWPNCFVLGKDRQVRPRQPWKVLWHVLVHTRHRWCAHHGVCRLSRPECGYQKGWRERRHGMAAVEATNKGSTGRSRRVNCHIMKGSRNLWDTLV